MTWTPHLTVAAIIERDGKFLMVEEIADQQAVINQPAGHVEENESIYDAVIREVHEETAWWFTPAYIVGIYKWRKPPAGPSFVRVCYAGSVANHDPAQQLDEGIIDAKWLSYNDIIDLPETGLRSPMVKKCIDDYLSGNQYSMDVIHELEIV